ncbi:unnamed protein product, partial [marine sediment metagenome]
DSDVHEMNWIDRMSGTEFEEYISFFFNKRGYMTQLTKQSHDFGGDIIVSGGLIRSIVQCKRSQDKISVSAVQQVYAASKVYQTERALVVTNNRFTSHAEILASIVGVELWDRRRLRLELIKNSTITCNI